MPSWSSTGSRSSTAFSGFNPGCFSPVLRARMMPSDSRFPRPKGTVTRTPQDHAAHTYAPMLDKSLSPLDFTRPARQLHDQVRGLVPWPSASMVLAGKPVKIHRTAVGEATDAPAGAVVTADKTGLSIACGDGKCLRILELQGEGGKRMAAADYLRGHPVPLGL